MKKRVLSALLALCLTLSLAGAAFAENEPSGDSSSAVSQAVSSVESEPQTQDETVSSDSASGEDQTAAKTESTPAPTETPAASDVTEEEPESTVTPEATEEPEVTAEPDATPVPTEDPVADVTENEESDGSVEYTATLETDGETMNVIVTAPEGAFAEDVQPELSVTMLTAEDELNAVADKLDTAEVQYDGFTALDITFTDKVTGEEIEPVKSVTVRIELPQAIVNSGIDLDTLAVSHLVENEQGNVGAVEQVASVADGNVVFSDEVKATMQEQVETESNVSPMMETSSAQNTDKLAEAPVVTEFEVDSFSYFVLHYFIDANPLEVQMVDTEGNPIGGDNSVGEISLGSLVDWNPSITVDDIRSEINTEVSGYSFKEARVVIEGENSEGEKYYETVVVNAFKINSLGSGMSNWGWAYRDENGEWNNMTIWNDLWGDESHTVYFVYTKDEPTEEPETPTVTVPEHSKKATISTDPQDTKGTYNLTLDVKGEINSSTSKMPLNLLLIIDKSGSMKESMSDGNGGQTTKKQAVVDAVSKLTSTLENNPAVDVRYDVVMFSGADDSGTGTVVPWTDDASQVNTAVKNFVANGGTNYQHGIQQAIRDLTVETTGMIKDGATCVIFLTDGEPTYRMWNGWELGNGSNDSGGYNIAAAVSEISRMSVDSFYCIGTGNDFTNENSQAVKNLQSLCDSVAATDTDWFRATNVKELDDAFSQIAGATTTLACNNITVTDTLSQWVDAVEGAEPYITVTDSNGETVKEGAKSVTLTNSTPQNPKEGYTITASYTADGKQLKLEFPSDYVLENGWTYSMTLKIKPNALAVNDFKEKDKTYPNTGDSGTGDHSGSGGYYSNADNAILTYKSVNDKPEDEATEAEYLMPVVQIDDSLIPPDTVDVTINKTIKDLNDSSLLSDLLNELKFTLTSKTDSTQNYTGDLVGVSAQNGVYSVVISGVIPGEYTLSESGQDIDNYDVEVEGIGDVTVSETGTNEFDVINSYTRKTGTLTLNKDIIGLLNASDISSANALTYNFVVQGPADAANVVAFHNPDTDEDVRFTSDGTGHAIVTVPVNVGNNLVINNLPTGNYTVTEIQPNAEDPNSNYEILNGKYYFDDTVTDNGAAWEGELTTEGAKATITNTYAPYKTLTIKKSVVGAMGTNDDWFDFDVTAPEHVTLNPTSAQETTTSGYDFKLNNGNTITLTKLKENDSITITENGNVNGYTAKGVAIEEGSILKDADLTGEQNNSVTITIPAGNEVNLGTVVFTNERNAVAPTGLEDNHTKPFGLMVGVAVMAGLALAGGAVVRRRRRWME